MRDKRIFLCIKYIGEDMIVSHRGYIKKYPENSYEGIFYAFNQSYIDGVEFDVRVTLDNKFVIIHDATTSRTSNKSGYINKKTYKELLGYDFNGTKIPLLSDILKINTNKIFLIELKLNDKEYEKSKFKLIKLLNKYKNKNLYICSFNKSIINDIKKYINFKTGVISYKKHEYDYDFSSINYIFFNETYLNDNMLFLWTINNKFDINNIWKYYKRDTLGIITDYPKLVKDVLDEHL